MFKVVGLSSNVSQADYIIASFSELNQVFNNLEYENLDQNSNIVTHFGIKLFPTFLLLKNDRYVDKLTGKHTLDEIIKWLKSQPSVE